MSEHDTTGGQENPRIEEMVLTRVGDNAVIRPLDGVTMDEVKRYIQAERSRTRRTVVWTGTLLLGVFLFFLVIFLSVGIYVIRTRASTGDALGTLRLRSAQQVAALATMSNRVALLETVQLDLNRLLEQVESSELTRTREIDGILADLAKTRSWVDELDVQRKENLSQIDGKLRETRDSTQQEISDVRGEIERLLGTMQSAVPAPRVDVAAGIGAALAGLPDLGAAMGGTSATVTAAVLDAVELTDEGLEASGVFDVEQMEAFDPGVERREITVVEFPSGDHYEGEMDRGLMHGWGVYAQRNGDRYDGEFRDGLKEGRGTLVYASGDKYLGDFRADLRAGRGALSYQNGDRYVGEFANDMPSGRGTMLYGNGNKYAGGFRNGLRHGPGLLRFANGDIYRGEFREDERTGLGAYAFADGSEYHGEFLVGRRQGQGRYVYASGEAYEGQFQDGARQGVGVSTFPNGKRIKGLWEGDKLVRYLPE